MSGLRLAFCSCNHPRVNPSQPGWLALAAHQPDALLLLGDNVYLENNAAQIATNLRPVDRLRDAAFAAHLHAQYAAQWRVPQFQAALSTVPLVLGTVDDHDFLGNDVMVGEHTQAKARIARALHRQFIAACNTRALPPLHAYPAMDAALLNDASPDPGFTEGLGLAALHDWPGIRLMLLDNRSFRTKKTQALGAPQIAWLAQALVGSQGISVVASGSPLSRGPRKLIRDSPLSAYPTEAAALAGLYAAQSHQLVLHLGGDMHYNAVWPSDPRAAHVLQAAASGMGSGWQPFGRKPAGNFGLVEIDADQQRLSVQTFGNDARDQQQRTWMRSDNRWREQLA